MADATSRVMGWPAIVGILVVVAVVVGLVMGTLGRLLDLTPTLTTGAVGASVGVVGALLVGRRRAALAQRVGG
jgi:hypothetical protein